jgi:hypothetical protein
MSFNVLCLAHHNDHVATPCGGRVTWSALGEGGTDARTPSDEHTPWAQTNTGNKCFKNTDRFNKALYVFNILALNFCKFGALRRLVTYINIPNTLSKP